MINKHFRKAYRWLALLSSFSIILNSFTPFVSLAMAEEITPTPTPVQQEGVTPQPTETQPTPTTEAEASPTLLRDNEIVASEGQAETTPELTPVPTPVETTPELTPVPTPTVAPAIEKECLTDGQAIKDTTNEDWNIDLEKGTSETKDKVKLGVKYVYPQENKVTVTFKCLPKDESLRTPLKIQRIKVSELNLPEGVNPFGEYAFDITTGMTDGQFEYDVTLPKPEGEEIGVSYIEKTVDQVKEADLKSDDIKQVVEEKLSQEGETIKALNLDHFTIFLTIDVDGPNDEAGQKDITKMTFDSSGLPNTEVITWNWDKIGWTGNNTGDACALFDIDTNGNADYALCVGVKNKPAVYDFTSLYLCNDTNADRCNTVGDPITPSAGTYCSASIQTDDPFPAGEDYPKDTKANCTIDLDDVGGAGIATLLNVCSYPSQQPNSDPSDCIGVIGGGFITIVKNANPNDGTAFNFNISNVGGTVYSPVINGSGTSTRYSVDVGTYGASETVPAGWNLTSASCVNQTGASEGTFSGNSITGINLVSGDDITCTFNDTKQACGDNHVDPGEECDDGNKVNTDSCLNTCQNAYCGDGFIQTNVEECDYADPANGNGCDLTCHYKKGTITFIKDSNPDSSQAFHFTYGANQYPIGSFNLTDDGGDGSETTTFTAIPAGTYSWTEDQVTGWNLTDITCQEDKTSNSSVDLANKSVSVVLDYGENVTCTFTNTKLPTLTVNKVVSSIDPSESGKFNLQIDGTTYAANVGNGGTTGAQVVSVGPHTVSETAGTGTLLSLYNIAISGNCASNGTITLAAGENKTCTITNTRKTAQVTINKKVDTDGNGTFESNDTTANTLGFRWQLDGGSDLQMGTTATYPLDTAGTMLSITENSVPGYHFVGAYDTVDTSHSCTNPSRTSLPIRVTQQVSPPRAFTICNARDIGRITFTKDVIGGTASPSAWTFEVDDTSGGMLGDTYAHGQTYSIPTGNYLVKETNKPHYNLTSASGVCTINPTNGKVEMVVGTNGGECKLTNTYVPYCGDGVKDTGEECDDGNTTNGDGCNSTCHIEYGSISGVKWEDMDGDGVRDVGDNPISGWTIKLDKDANGTIDQTTTTDAEGLYVFNNLLPGAYKVIENTTSPWNQSFPSPGYQYNLNLSAGDNLTDKDFGNYKNGKIEGFKWEDIDGDGVKEAGETAPANQWGINLWKEVNGIKIDEGIVYTQPDGSYSFGRIPGTYYLSEVDQTGWTQTYPATEFIGPIVVTSGSLSQNNNFGNYKLGSISGMKFEDMNGNGVKDPGDNGLQGWTIYLDLNANGQLDAGEPSQVTTANGTYSFTGLTRGNYHGGYSIREVLKPGWELTVPINSYWVSSPSGMNEVNKDFGNFELGKIQGRKYEDLNNDGTWDTGEPYLDDWTIRAYKKSGSNWDPVGTYNTGDTGATGQYRFENLTLGRYKICEVLQSGWTQTNPTGIANNVQSDEAPRCRILDITGSGQVLSGKHFGNIQYGSISGEKWEDVNGNHIWDNGEPFVDGTTLANGLMIFIDKNDNGQFDGLPEYGASIDYLGRYSFGQLIPGTYHICERDDQLVDWARTYPTGSNCQLVNVNAGQDSIANFGNRHLYPNVTITKAVTDGIMNPLGEFEFTLEATNSGEAIARNVMINDYLPLNFTYVAGSTTGETTSDPSITGTPDTTGQTLSWGPFDIGIGEKATIIFSATAPDTIVTDRNCVETTIRAEQRLTAVTNDEIGDGMEENGRVCVDIETQAPAISLTKTNDKLLTPISIGTVVTYTLKVKNTNENVLLYKTFVRDVRPFKATYQTGTTTAVSGISAHNPFVLAEPTCDDYSCEWSLGTLSEGEEVTITYQLKIDNAPMTGTYWNMAFAYGHDSPNSHKLDSEIVDSPIVIDKSLAYSGAVKPGETGVVLGAVLGASTSLPATGAKIWIIITEILAIIGALLLRNKFMKRARKSLRKKMSAIVLLAAGCLLMTTGSQANAGIITSKCKIDINNLKSPQNTGNITISYVTMDTDVTTPLSKVEYYYRKNAEADQIITVNTTNLSGEKLITVDPHDTHYFSVKAYYENGDSCKSVETSTTIDSKVPSALASFSFARRDGNSYEICFKTPDDDDVAKVKIFRSDKEEFTADSGSEVHSEDIGKNVSKCWVNDGLEGGKNYYYAGQVFDAVGNGSAISYFNKTVTTTTTTTTTGETSGGQVAGTEAQNVITTEAGVGTGTGAGGSILGEETTTESGKKDVTPTEEVKPTGKESKGGGLLGGNNLTIVLIGLGVLVIAGIAYFLLRNREE